MAVKETLRWEKQPHVTSVRFVATVDVCGRRDSFCRVTDKSSTQIKTRARRAWNSNKHIAIGVDIGGTFTDVILVDERRRPHLFGQGADHAGAARRRRCWTAVAQVLEQAKSRHDCGAHDRARHDAGDQRHHRAQGRAHRAAHHARLSRCARDRNRASLRPARSLHRIPRAAGAAPSAHRHHRTRALRRRTC